MSTLMVRPGVRLSLSSGKRASAIGDLIQIPSSEWRTSSSTKEMHVYWGGRRPGKIAGEAAKVLSRQKQQLQSANWQARPSVISPDTAPASIFHTSHPVLGTLSYCRALVSWAPPLHMPLLLHLSSPRSLFRLVLQYILQLSPALGMLQGFRASFQSERAYSSAQGFPLA